MAMLEAIKDAAPGISVAMQVLFRRNLRNKLNQGCSTWHLGCDGAWESWSAKEGRGKERCRWHHF
jgi:hypothetical protein